MTKRHTPARKSNLCVVSENPFGPHQLERCLGSVHAPNTRARGASNTRLPMITFGSCFRSIRNVSATALFLPVHQFELVSIGDRLARSRPPLRPRARLLLLSLQ